MKCVEVCAWKWPLGRLRSMWKDVIKSIYKVMCQAVGVGTGIQLCLRTPLGSRATATFL